MGKGFAYWRPTSGAGVKYSPWCDPVWDTITQDNVSFVLQHESETYWWSSTNFLHILKQQVTTRGSILNLDDVCQPWYEEHGCHEKCSVTPSALTIHLRIVNSVQLAAVWSFWNRTPWDGQREGDAPHSRGWVSIRMMVIDVCLLKGSSGIEKYGTSCSRSVDWVTKRVIWPWVENLDSLQNHLSIKAKQVHHQSRNFPSLTLLAKVLGLPVER